MRDDANLADALGHPDVPEGLTTGTIVGVDTDGLTVDTGLAVGRALAINSSWVPAQGDIVVVDTSASPQWIAFGVIRTTYPTTQSLVRSYKISYNVAPVPSAGGTGGTGGGTGVTSGTKVVAATSTGSYRSADGWSKVPPYQGAFSPSRGYYFGCWFYGASAFSDLTGRTCTRLRVFLRRGTAIGAGGVGSSASLPLMIANHAHASQPSGPPTMTSGAVLAGSLTAPTTTVGATFDLPVSLGQQLIDGVARGICLLDLSTANYLRCLTVAEDADSGKLTIDWTT